MKISTRISSWIAIVVAVVVLCIAAVMHTQPHHRLLNLILWRQQEPDDKGEYHFYENLLHNNLHTPTKDDDDDEWKLLEGYWTGTLAGRLRLVYRITPTHGNMFIYSIDQGGAFIPATGTTVHNRKVRFFFETIDGVHSATLDKTGQRLVGTWQQHGFSGPLEMQRFRPSEHVPVPPEFRFVSEMVVTGNPAQLASMEGYWSGYLAEGSNKDEEDAPSEFVILQVEKTAPDLVEPKVFLSDTGALPLPVRDMVVLNNLQVKLVLSGGPNAIFVGKLQNPHTMVGAVQYDDVEDTTPLTLVWSAHRPNRTNIG